VENLELEKRQPGTSQRISERYGALLIETLRHRFGGGFAVDIPARAKLDDVLHELDKPSLDKLASAVAPRS
jgi:hypothetical protein